MRCDVHAERVPYGFLFTCAVADSSLRVELRLCEDGTEFIAVCADRPLLRLPPEQVPSGTIERCLGDELWAEFGRLRRRGFGKVCIECSRGSGTGDDDD